MNYIIIAITSSGSWIWRRHGRRLFFANRDNFAFQNFPISKFIHFLTAPGQTLTRVDQHLATLVEYLQRVGNARHHNRHRRGIHSHERVRDIVAPEQIEHGHPDRRERRQQERDHQRLSATDGVRVVAEGGARHDREDALDAAERADDGEGAGSEDGVLQGRDVAGGEAHEHAEQELDDEQVGDGLGDGEDRGEGRGGVGGELRSHRGRHGEGGDDGNKKKKIFEKIFFLSDLTIKKKKHLKKKGGGQLPIDDTILKQK